jgi:hypothetical protein
VGRRRQRRGGERIRRVHEVEAVGERVHRRVGRSERTEVEGFLDEPQDAAVVVLRVRDMVRLGVRRDEDHRDSHTQAGVVNLRGRGTGSYHAPVSAGSSDAPILQSEPLLFGFSAARGFKQVLPRM